MLDPIALVLAAFIIDMLIGDPPALYRRIAHPVVVIGRAIAHAEQRMNVAGATPTLAIARGGLLVFVLLVAVFVLGVLIHRTLATFAPGVPGALIEAVVASTLIAWRSLYEHVRAVALGLENGVQAARVAVAHIVGRDPRTLDEAGVARAAIESAAENFSDGVVAPLFWMLLLGLPGLLVYKTVNTLDSMIGHRSPRYEYFGRIAARLDDLLNWVPARLAGCVLCIAALLMPGARCGAAVRCMVRDARKHRSPNAGWPEAAVAGALGIALGGPRVYDGERVDQPWMGAPQAIANPVLHAGDVHRALHLYLIAGAVTAALLTLAVALAAMRA